MPATSVRVRFATNRNRLKANSPNLFGPEFQGGNPKNYVTGSIDVLKLAARPDTGWVPQPSSLVIDPPEAAPTVAEAMDAAAEAEGGMVAFADQQAAAGAAPGFGLVLIPGFAATFLDSMRRAAQIAAAYRASNVFCFSWPANGVTDIPNYKEDRKDAAKSGAAMAGALAQLLAKLESMPATQRPKLHIVAHSMGNFALRAAVQTIKTAKPGLIKEDTFEGALMMAADEDLDALSANDKLRPLLKLAKRVTVYHAGGDMALGISQSLNGPRIGHLGPANLSTLPDHVTAIDCSDVAATSGDKGESHFSHQYYRLSQRVIGDVVQVLAGKAPNKVGGRLDSMTGAKRAFWLPFDANAGFA